MNIIEGVTHPGPENGTWVVKEGRHVRVIEVDGSPKRTFLSTRGNHPYPPGTTGERPAPGVAQILARQR